MSDKSLKTISEYVAYCHNERSQKDSLLIAAAEAMTANENRELGALMEEFQNTARQIVEQQRMQGVPQEAAVMTAQAYALQMVFCLGTLYGRDYSADQVASIESLVDFFGASGTGDGDD